MIRRIKTTEYLKQYGAMSDEERKAYWGRVGAWLQDGGKRLLEMTDRPMAKAQNVVMLSARWTKEDCQAFFDGTVLLSSLIGVADTWLPTQLYAKSAYRAVRQMWGTLVLSQDGTGVPTGTLNGTFVKVVDKPGLVGYQYVENTGTAPAGKPQGTRPAEKSAGTMTDAEIIQRAMREDQTRAIKELEQRRKAGFPPGKPTGTRPAGKSMPMIKTVSKEYDPKTDTVRVQCAVVPARPKHIDQYVHLLPEKTQERAAQYGPLMRDMGAARESLWLLMDDPQASSGSREQWAKVIKRIDEQVGSINRELDAEWEKVARSGRVVVDALGVAHVVNGGTVLPEGEGGPDGTLGPSGTLATNGTQEPSGTVAGVPDQATMIAKAKARTPEQKKRLDQLKKFLRDRRLPEKGREAYVQKFREYHDEMVRDYGAEYFTDTMQENAKALGIEF